MSHKKHKDLVKKAYIDEEKARIVKYLERVKRKPLRFKSGKAASDKPCLELHTTDKTLSAAKLTEALILENFQFIYICLDNGMTLQLLDSDK